MCRIRYFTVARICLHEYDPVYCQQMFFFFEKPQYCCSNRCQKFILHVAISRAGPAYTVDVQFHRWPRMMFGSTGGHGWCWVRLVTTDDDQFHRWPQMMFSSTGYHRWCWLRQVATDDAQIDRWPRMMFSSAGGHGWCSVPPVATDDVQFIVIVNR